MAVHVVRLGSPRTPGEGTRFGTVRRPPRGVAKDRFASEDWYDVWLPVLAPSAGLMAEGRAATTDAEWRRFSRRYEKEMAASDPAGVVDALARLSHTADFAVGCYCEDESRCHRSVLRRLLAERGAELAG
jgi:uncharacterized protein YeaO (DUF488 family)